MPLYQPVFCLATASRTYEAAGIHYEVRRVRDLLVLGRDPKPVYHPPREQSDGAAGDSTVANSSDDEEELDVNFDPDDEAYEKYLKSLNPAETKEQDHYKVLGLSRLRWTADEEQIRISCLF